MSENSSKWLEYPSLQLRTCYHKLCGLHCTCTTVIVLLSTAKVGISCAADIVDNNLRLFEVRCGPDVCTTHVELPATLAKVGIVRD